MLFAHAMQTTTFAVVRSLVSCLVASIYAVTLVHAQAETFAAVASMKTAGGVSTTAPLTVVVDKFATDADQKALIATVKSGNSAAIREWLQKRPDAGTLQIGSRRTAIKYVYVRPTADGRLITVATAEPIAFVGAGVPGAKPTAGYDLGLVLLNVMASGPGHGELSPAAKVRVNEQGALVTEDYNAADVVQLSNVVKK
ncbi:MAG TPA: hypothetical protein VGF24_21740 [Vicinamibacterales bacterium]|jgi:hypothetical protein